MHRPVLVLALLGMLTLLPSCNTETTSKDPYLGNLDDTSYANRRDKIYPTADDYALSLADFSGDFVWLDFAAPWCPPCGPQAKVIERLEDRQDNVVFVTMITSDHDPMTAATPATASAWARRHRLDPSRVATCTETRVVPSHMLFSPEGHLLYWSEGTHSLAQIQAVLSEETDRWMQATGYSAR